MESGASTVSFIVITVRYKGSYIIRGARKGVPLCMLMRNHGFFERLGGFLDLRDSDSRV